MRATFIGLAAAAVIGVSADSRLDHYVRINPKFDIVWHACPAGTAADFDCGSFEVPLDYADHSKGAAVLAIARLNATVTPKLGIMFTNPGGPGGSGVDDVLGGAQSLSKDYLGGAYDIVSWDPRGVGLTTPRIDCFNSTREENAFWKTSTIYNGVEVRGAFTNADNTDPDVIAFWAEEPKMDKLMGEFGQKCLEKNGENLKYVGTAAAARDMERLSHALQGPDELVNFWGFSYGTAIVAYFVNMFPQRVGRIIADGVINPYVWATEPAHHLWAHTITDIDGLYAGFAASCAMAGPRGCAIAWSGSTEKTIIQWTQKLMDAAYDYNKAGGPISSGSIRNEIFSAMYSPTSWPLLAEALYDSAAEIYNTTTTAKTRRSVIKKRASDASTYDTAFHAITCADAIDTGDVTTKDVFLSIIDTARTVSQMFAPAMGDAGFYCHKWPARAVERFTGPFNMTLKTPILVIGNEFDPVTPFAGAKALADGLGDSAVLMKQDDYGHLSLAQHSDCTLSIINAFWANGTYPVEDQFCPTNQILFPQTEITKEKLLNAAAHSDSVPGTEGVAQPLSQAIQDELDSLRASRQSMLIGLGALTAAFLLALGGLLFMVFRAKGRGRRSGPKYAPVAVPGGGDSMRQQRGSMDTLQGSSYADGGKGYTDRL